MDPAEVRRATSSTDSRTRRSPAPTTTPASTARRWRSAWPTPATTQLRADQNARRDRGDVVQLGLGLCSYVEWTGFGSELGTCEVLEDGTVDRDRGHVLARPGPRDRLRAARRRHARHPARGRQGHPVRHQAGQARHGHDGLALAAGRRHAPSSRRPTRCSRRPAGSPRTCSRPTRATSRSCTARGSASPARPPRRSRGRSSRPRPGPVARPRGLRGRPGVGERLRDAGRDVPVRHAPRGRRGRHRDRARAARPAHHRRRLRPDPQPDAGRGPGPRRHRPGRRAGAVRGDRLRRGRQQRHRLAGLLRDPERRRPADASRPSARRRRRRATRSGPRASARRARSARRRRSGTPSSTRSHLGVRNIDMPATPQRVWQAISAAGDLVERAEQRVDVRDRRAEPDARPDRPGQLGLAAGRSSACSRRASASGTSQQARDQRVRAEAAVADADRVLVAQERRERRGLVAGEREAGDADAVVVHRATGRAGEAGDAVQAARADARRARARGRRRASMPIASSASQAAAKATAPITFGEPASKRSGASAQITSSSVTSLIAPPPCSSGSPSSGARLTSAPAPNGA